MIQLYFPSFQFIIHSLKYWLNTSVPSAIVYILYKNTLYTIEKVGVNSWSLQIKRE